MGVCARNEESGILLTLDSIVRSAQRSNLADWHLAICANGCTDMTVPQVRSWQARNPKVVSVLLVRDEGSLVEAQREISQYKNKSGLTDLIFFGADVLVDEDCIKELLNASFPSNIVAAYAVSVPITNKKETFVEQVLNQYDLSPTIFSPRKHLHGRSFLIKDWNMPITNPPLFVDDIYLSFYLLTKYGPGSIARAEKAKVHFHQISSYRDFHNTFKRRKKELQKCFSLFPEFKSLPADQINREISFRKLLKEPPKRFIKWMALLLLRKASSVRLKLSRGGKAKNWIAAGSTKKGF